jgi:phosphoribosylanthranilate isomerase
MVKVKICGITNWVDARRAVKEGADFLGFNFYRKSPRYVGPAVAARIINRLPRRIKAVGVFVNEPEADVLDIARQVKLHQVQLHGDESPDTVERLQREFPVIKAIRVRGGRLSSQLKGFAKADAMLLDGFDRKQYGGTGKTFVWNVLRRATPRQKLFLAGGLTAENVAEAIRVGKPYAVDVCGGVESRPGKKDPKRVVAFLRAAKSSAKSAAASKAKRRTKGQVRKKS